MVSEENATVQALLLEKEREKQLLAQNKTATSKHLSKLQQDMQDWRKQTDENMKIKDKQIEELQSQVSTLQKERDRLKSESLMLRRVDKDRRNGENEEIKRLQDENNELNERLNQHIDDRRKEVEYWVSERATMRQMIEQLENEKVAANEVADAGAVTILPEERDADAFLKQFKKKNHKKLKEKEVELKAKMQEIESMRNEIHRCKQVETQLEQRLRECNFKLQDTED